VTNLIKSSLAFDHAMGRWWWVMKHGDSDLINIGRRLLEARFEVAEIPAQGMKWPDDLTVERDLGAWSKMTRLNKHPLSASGSQRHVYLSSLMKSPKTM